MGIFDDSFLGGMFDLNKDGKVDLGEEFMAFKMFEEVTREDEDEDDDLFKDEDDRDDDFF